MSYIEVELIIKKTYSGFEFIGEEKQKLASK